MAKKKKTQKKQANNDLQSSQPPVQNSKDDKKMTDLQKNSHQEQLNRLKEKDPEFYKFLESEDQSMLNFDANADDELLTSDEEADVDEDVHQIPQRLEVASDDEDFEDSSDNEEDEAKIQIKKQKKQQIVVDKKMIKNWEKLLTTENSSINCLREVLEAYHGCLARIDADDQEGGKKKKSQKDRTQKPSHKYKVVTDTAFNSLINLCMQHVPRSLDTILQYDSKGCVLNKKGKVSLPSSCKRWSNIRNTLREYLDDVLTLTLAIVGASETEVFLSHMQIMLPYYLSFPKVCKKLARLLIKLWSTSDDGSVRINSFRCLYRLVNLDKKRMYENVLKQCYLSYVANSKFTSPTLLPMINFMQVSFCEVCAIDSDATYRFAFLYIRQLAVHLRKAIVENNKETRKAVYNWQFVHCVALWCRVLSKLHPNPTLQPLIYPLIQVALGMIELVPTPRFYPLRFHVVRNLVKLGNCTNVYIPLLPFITAPLLLQDFKKKQLGTSLKPLSFDCILKLSNSQIKEKSYRDSTMDHIYDLLMTYFNSHAHTIAFPEMAVPTIVILKKYAKNCKSPQYAKMMRRVVEKVEENMKHITKERSKVTFAVTDDQWVDSWESNIKTDGVPFNKHYEVYEKKRMREHTQQIADKDRNVEEKLPTINRDLFMNAESKEADRIEFDQLFNAGEEGDLERDFESALKKKADPTKKPKISKRKPEESGLDEDEDFSDDNEDQFDEEDEAEESDGDESEVSMDSDIPLTSDDEEEEVVQEKPKASKNNKQKASPTKKAVTKKTPASEVKSKKAKKIDQQDEPTNKKSKISLDEDEEGGESDGSDVVQDFDISQF